MKKTDKKTENRLTEALTEVCEIALETVVGFKWLTHFADYDRFPESLSVVCVFDTNAQLADARASHEDDFLRGLIREKLEAADIKVKDIRQHVDFDTEEDCKKEHGGKWRERFR